MSRNVFIPDAVVIPGGKSTASTLQYKNETTKTAKFLYDATSSEPLPPANMSGIPEDRCSEQSGVVQQPRQNFVQFSADPSPVARQKIPRQEFSGGASIDVSPNGSWLAWFKRLPAPSPSSIRRLSPANAAARQKSSALEATETATSSPRNSSSPTETQDAGGEAPKSTDSTDHLKSCSVLTQETRASQRTQSPTKGLKEQFTTRVPAHKQTTFFRTKVKQPLSRLGKKVKNHPYITGIFIISILVLISATVLIIFFWLIPKLIQDIVNATELEMVRSLLSNPDINSFSLDTDSLLSRPSGHRVIIGEFEANVFYSPDILAPPGPGTSRALLDDDKQDSMDNINVLNDLYVDKSDGDPTMFQIRGSRDLQSRMLEQVASSNDEFLIGSMVLPSTVLEGQESKVTYHSKFNVVDTTLFNAFLREFMTTGEARWRMRGIPVVTLMGLSYPNIIFDKTLVFHGPRLAHTEEDLWDLFSADQLSAERNWWQDNYVPRGNDQYNDTVRKEGPLNIAEFDFSDSTPTEARIYVKIKLNVNSGVAIDPVGVIVFSVIYHDIPIVDLRSAEVVSIQPGDNEFNLFGSLSSLDLSTETHVALSDLFSSVFRGESPILETRGISSSISLYNPAVEAIRLYTPLILAADESEEPITVIRNMDVEQIEINPSKEVSSMLNLKGWLNIILSNPFGPKVALKVSEVVLSGKLQLYMPDDDSSEEILTIAVYSGRLSGIRRSQIVYTKDGPGVPLLANLGIMPVSVQTVPLLIDVSAALQEKALKRFIEYFLHSDSLVLALTDARAIVELTETPLGTITLKDIPLNKEFIINGFKNMEDFKLVDLTVDVPKSTTSGEFDVMVSVAVPSKAAASMSLGTITVRLKHNSKHITFLSASNCRIKHEDNLLNFTGRTKLADMNIAMIYPILMSYMSGKTTFIEIEFINPIDVNMTFSGQPAKPKLDSSSDWLQDSLIGLEITMPIPGRPPPRSDGTPVQGMFSNVLNAIMAKFGMGGNTR